MQLVDAVFRIAEMDSNQVLCAKKPFTWGSEALIATFTNDYRVPESVVAAGYEYLLGQEDIVLLIKQASQKRLSAKTIAELVCHYAVTDSYPAWFSDLPEARSSAEKNDA